MDYQSFTSFLEKSLSPHITKMDLRISFFCPRREILIPPGLRCSSLAFRRNEENSADEKKYDVGSPRYQDQFQALKCVSEEVC